MIGTAVFAITGVLAVSRRGPDVFGALVLGVVTAIGGGTLRDLIVGAPVFWLADFNYAWAAAAGAIAAFWVGPRLRTPLRPLLYLDGLGAGLFAVTAAHKVLELQLAAPIAVVMGVLTGIGGGLARDVLAGRTTLLMSREVYATPILLGCTLFVVLRAAAPGLELAPLLCVAVIFGLRALAIRFHVEMPDWLTAPRTREDPD